MPSDNARAAIFMLVSMGGFVVNDTFVKIVSQEISPPQIMALRGVVASVFVLVIAWRMHALRSLTVALKPRLVLRTVADIGATVTYITALSHMPIANASAVFQALPLAVTVGAALFLKEPVGWRRWTAIAAGFAGVLIIVRPGTEGFNVFSLSVLGSVVFSAIRDLATRGMDRNVPTLFIALTTAIAVSLTGWVLIPAAGGWQPVSAVSALCLLSAAAAVALGYVFIVLAMRTGDMGFVAPFRYAILVYALVIGYVVFGDLPTLLTIFGACLVVAKRRLHLLSRAPGGRAGRRRAGKDAAALMRGRCLQELRSPQPNAEAADAPSPPSQPRPSSRPSVKPAGLILAGGRGSRMGEGPPKPLRLLGGRPLISHVAERLRGAVDPLLVNAAEPAAYAALGLPVVADLRPGFQGPLAGIEAGLAHLAGHGGPMPSPDGAGRHAVPPGGSPAALSGGARATGGRPARRPAAPGGRPLAGRGAARPHRLAGRERQARGPRLSRQWRVRRRRRAGRARGAGRRSVLQRQHAGGPREGRSMAGASTLMADGRWPRLPYRAE